MTQHRSAIAPRCWLVVASLALASCATIPGEATTLSAELGAQIESSKLFHENTVRSLMSEKRAAVDRFIETEWLPAFARNSFSTPAVQAIWDEAVQAKDPKARLDIVVGLGTRLQGQINKQRAQMMQPLDEIERDLIAKLDEHYNQMLAANSALTGLLGSAAKLSDTREKILTALHAQKAVDIGLSKADEVVHLLTQGTDALQKNKGKIDAILKSLNQ